MLIEGYTELQTLGGGASGSVILARHESSGQLVAIKILSTQLVTDPVFLQRFRDEAGILQRLRHPNIVAVYGYVERPGEAAITMELVNGVTLRRMLGQGPTVPEAALVVLRGSLLALDHAHRAGVVHRDYKPENVMVDGEGISRLIDFGVAVQVGDSGWLAGTPRYMAPEQWSDGRATQQTDVYAATSVFFECVTGTRPFNATTLSELRAEHLRAPIPVDAVPAGVRELVARGMAKLPAHRYPDAGAFLGELEAAAVAAYGPDWLERGTAAMAASALGMVALFPLTAGVGATTASAAGTAVASTTLATTEAGAAGVAAVGTAAATGGAAATAAAGAGIGALLVPGIAALVIAGAAGGLAVKTDGFGLRSTGSSAASGPGQSQVGVATASSRAGAPSGPANTTSGTAARSDIGPNLLVNGNADAGPGSTDGANVTPSPGWTTTATFSTNSWDIADPAFMQRGDPGPPDRGANYFIGGPESAVSSATQSIDLGGQRTQIAQGATYQLSAWLGGVADRGDNMAVIVEFFDASGTSVGTGRLQPVTEQARNGRSGLVYEAVTGRIPASASRAVVTMTATRSGDPLGVAYNDGSADDVSFEVSTGSPGVALPGTG